MVAVTNSLVFSNPKITVLVAEHGVEAVNMYDTDETGFVMSHAQSRRVIEIIYHPRDKNGRIFPADLRELNLRAGGRALRGGSREFATVICCICADGTVTARSKSCPECDRMREPCECLERAKAAIMRLCVRTMSGRGRWCENAM